MMEQTERHKTKYTKPYASSWTNGYQTRSREIPESTWKYVQRNPLTVSSNRPNRQHKHHACTSVTHPKYTTALVQSSEIPHRYSHSNSRSIKERSLGDNVALMRGARYKDEVDDESPKYIDDELGNFTEDNADEDAAEEEDEEEEAADDPEKDYEEPEADDEVDDDTEISPQLQRMQRRVKNDALLRAQRMRDAERQQDLRRLRYQPNPSKLYEDRASSKRYYHNAPESDTGEPASEEEQVEPPVALRNPNRRAMTTGRHHTLHTWPQTRNSGRSEMTRYDASMAVPGRRVRAWRDAEHLPKPRSEIGAAKKCSRCGGSDRKTSSSSKKAICRLQNHRDFPNKGPVGDDIEPNEDAVCGRCNLRHGSEKTSGSCEFPRSGLYSLEPRRSRDTRTARTSVYETPEDVRTIDEVSEDYATAKTRHCRENPGLYRQSTKHSLQPPRDRTRTPSEYRV